MSTLALRRSVVADMLHHARAAAPEECCGLLLGREDGPVEMAVRARNRARLRRTRFLIDPRDHFDAIRRARNARLAIVGFYHSHPASPPAPSPRDLAGGGGAGAVHVIVSLEAGSRLAAFRQVDSRNFVHLEIVPIP